MVKNLKVDDFESCKQALDFIDELKKKHNCAGYLSNTPFTVEVLDGKTQKKVKETNYKWHVKYNASKLKKEEKNEKKDDILAVHKK